MVEVIIFSNTRGFQKNKIEIDRFIGSHKPIIFLVAEHFQSNNTHLTLDGYVLAASYCRFARERGGVAIFVRADLEFKARKDLDSFNVKKQFEARSVEVPSINLVVTVVYRPPSGKLKVFHENLDSILKLYKKEATLRHVMAGDFNVNNCDRNSTVQILERARFKFTFSSKTHDAGKCLDNFIIDFLPSSQNIMEEKLSDHNCVQLVLPTVEKNPVCTLWDLPENVQRRRVLGEKTFVSSVGYRRNLQMTNTNHFTPSKSNIFENVSDKNDILVEVSKISQFPSAKQESVVCLPTSDELSSEIVNLIVECLLKDDLVDNIASRFSVGSGNVLFEPFEEIKDQIQYLQDKVASMEDIIIKLKYKLSEQMLI